MSLHLVKGTDPVLRDRTADALVRELLEGEDRALALEEVTVPGRGAEADAGGAEDRQAAVGTLLNAMRTPPFMTARRVVVAREVGNLTKDDVTPLLAELGDLTPGIELVFVSGGGTTPKALEDRVKASGSVTSSGGERAADVLARESDRAGVSLRPDAARTVLDHVGDDAGLLPVMVETLAAVHGPGTTLDVDAITPYLGDEGSVPTWDLTNAIEQGDAAEALVVLRRLLTVTSPTQPKAMHPLQLLARLHNYYRRLLVLDDPAVVTNEDAAAAIGGRTNPRAAGFRLRQARMLGTGGLRQAFDHLARADLDLKGERAIPAEAVMEILVVRLAALSQRSGAGSGRRR